ncbi:flagellar motor switch protein FliN [Brachyspira alvinipulli]|uniref:flagellar motor switch protein FliN n=1 Tax=Brachyspira alvinipulli TaxID=84379 RepID=UPI000482551C|nr:flagellar motor switch protein FliN [Brachyspira alvinipulli]
MSDKKQENESKVNATPSSNISLLMDVSINVTVELGRARLSIREILELGEGSIIELQKLAGEPVDLLVNGKLIARGEVVVIDECFGVRITDIMNSTDILVENISKTDTSNNKKNK